ncbi:DMT family transporter [Methylobacterium oxalidis]|uniref:Membrane protein n=1 Tax=Methylobacterium oxalidis TaxID=944322 RepID=A0A512J080_9HYPH|nr:DMT family transporter [Methylobacterium oxalidis]GEP03380.1 membrane protein [Methylobacterium oxalidis]GJE33038.1 hypothetical protein LDDCCGHA_3237 [Methylobacterium oxalidis]GLS63425.1 membrane protein [Methylobacterium oxalidis]
MSPTSTAAGRRAYGLLTLTALLWAGNAAAGKMAVGEVSPQALTCLRWAVACAALAVFARRPLLAEWHRIVPSWRRVLAMGACGYTIYASLFYAAGTLTRGVNLALLQGAIPVLVILLNFAVYRRVVTWGQGVGVAITLLGAAVAASHGDWRVLATLDFNRGDLLMLAACVLYAGYTVALPSRPKVSSLTFFTAMAAAALATSLPLLLAEWAAGQTIWPTPKGWLIAAFVGLGPSLAAQLFFMRGVELIGPNRAGVFVNLVPVFGAALAVLLVGEPFGWNDALALALVLGGILVAERLGRRPAP